MSKIIPQDDFNETEMFRPAAINTGNPLSQYFRMPGCNVQLPTRGAFLPPDMIELQMDGSVAVYPMKAADELLLRSPDALMSGYALEKLIESCVPAIKAPRRVSSPDLDVILLAIRAATYGDTMEIEVECPNCKHENLFECDLSIMLSQMTFIDPENPLELSNGLVAYLRPYSMEAATKAALGSFHEIRKLQSIENEDQKRMAQSESLSVMSKLNLDGIADSIAYIKMPNGALVSDRDHIAQFVHNTSQAHVKKLQDKLGEINAMGVDKSVDAVCAKCNHEWSPAVDFDPTSFFGQSS